MARAGIYVRISDDRVGAGLGVARQEQDCRALCQRLDLDAGDAYIDNDLSAYSGKPRPAYQQLLADIEAGIVDVVIAWHPDRLHRSPLELEHFIALLERTGATVQTVTAGVYDLSTPAGRMNARIVGATARHESEHKSARARRKARELAEAGKVSGGGRRPFGYEHDRVTVRPAEAAVIREAADRVLAGHSLRSICMDFDARGIRTSTGTSWSLHVLRRLLTSWRIAGLRAVQVHDNDGGKPIAEAVWPAIVDVATLEQVRAVLLDAARRRVRSPRRYLLRGFALCSRCGKPLVSRPRDDGVRRYVCATGPGFFGCGRTYVLAEPVEEMVRSDVIDVITSGRLAELLAAAPSTGRAALVTQLRDAESGLEELAVAHFAERAISAGEYRAAREALAQRVAALTGRLTAVDRSGVLAAVAGTAADVNAKWDAADITWRRAVVGAVLADVTIGPGRRGYNRFDPARVTYRWLA